MSWVCEIHLAYLRIFFWDPETNQLCETILRKRSPPQATSRKTGTQLSRAGLNRNAAG